MFIQILFQIYKIFQFNFFKVFFKKIFEHVFKFHTILRIKERTISLQLYYSFKFGKKFNTYEKIINENKELTSCGDFKNLKSLFDSIYYH